MAHLHSLSPTLHLLGKKLSSKFKLDQEQSSLENALRRLEKADAQPAAENDVIALRSHPRRRSQVITSAQLANASCGRTNPNGRSDPSFASQLPRDGPKLIISGNFSYWRFTWQRS
jgi:hypothetical protein